MAINLNLGEIIKEVGIAGAMAALIEGLKEGAKNGGKKVGEKAVEKIAKKFEEYRDEFLAFVRSLASHGIEGRAAFDNLQRRWKARQLCQPRTYSTNEPYKPGDEDIFVDRLTKLYISLNEPQERDTRIEVFKWLGCMPDEEFDVFLELLNHDFIIQWIRRSWMWLKEVWGKFYSTDPQVPGLYQQLDKKLNQKLAPVNKRVKKARNQLAKQVRAERKGRKRWTSLWSF